MANQRGGGGPGGREGEGGKGVFARGGLARGGRRGRVGGRGVLARGGGGGDERRQGQGRVELRRKGKREKKDEKYTRRNEFRKTRKWRRETYKRIID